MSAISPTFADRLAEQADRVQDARTALTAKYQAEMDRHLSREGELRGAALAVPPQEVEP
jgi:hypothetical protein